MDLFSGVIRLFVAGRAESGKTKLVVDILLSDTISPSPDAIILCYTYMQPEYKRLEKKFADRLILFQGFPVDTLLDKEFLKQYKRPLLVLDDGLKYFRNKSNLDALEEILTGVSHHHRLSVILIKQTLFTGNGTAITQQATHWIIKKNS